MRVLLIEGDADTAKTVELMLKSEGVDTYTTDLGEEGVDLGRLYDYEAILTEAVLPDISGFEVVNRLRASKIKTPIIFVSGLAAIADKVKGLALGADDYMTKPFHRDELVARIHAVVRRSNGHAESKITFGNAELNMDKNTLTVGGAKVHLTHLEYRLMESLALRKNSVVTKEVIFGALYGVNDDVEIKMIDVKISHLRGKLSHAGAIGFDMKAVWGRGYTLEEGEDLRVLHNKAPSPLTPEKLEALIADYKRIENLKRVSAMHGISRWQAGAELKRAGVPTRGRGNRARGAQ